MRRDQAMFAISASHLAEGTKEDYGFGVDPYGALVALRSPMMGDRCQLIKRPQADGRHIRDIGSHLAHASKRRLHHFRYPCAAWVNGQRVHEGWKSPTTLSVGGVVVLQFG
jgi:hypothetical protein